MQRTVLFPAYAVSHPTLGCFMGSLYPQAFNDPVGEHLAVREQAGLFDLSFMGQYAIEGPGALDLIQRLITNDADRLAQGQILYSPICDEAGRFVNDCTAYRLGIERFLIFTSLRTSGDWLRSLARREVAITDQSLEVAILALQGPNALTVLRQLGVADFSLRYYHAVETCIEGIPVLLSRIGYTGEHGYELAIAATSAGGLWEQLLEVGRKLGLVPCGAIALNSLRIEAGYLLAGQDFDGTQTPLGAGLERLVRFEKAEFLGREALLELRDRGIPFRLRGFALRDQPVPARGDLIFSERCKVPIGKVTSGCYSPSFRRGLALGYLARGAVQPGQSVAILAREERCQAQAVSLPFYDPGRARVRGPLS